MRTTVDRLRWAAVTYEPYWLIFCLLIATCLRLFRLEAQSLWADEGVQYFIASAPTLDALWERIDQRTFHPPLSFLISHAFLRMHDSDFVLRLPSVLFGVGSLWLTYGLVKKWTSVPVALVTAWVFAISPLHVWYSQEARMYAPLIFIALLSTVCFVRAVESQRWLWWGAYAGSLALGLYIHVFIALQIIVHGVWLLIWFRRAWWAYCATGVVTAVLAYPIISPWVLYVLRRVSPGLVEGVATASRNRVAIGWEGIFYALYAYGAGFSLGPSLIDLHNSRSVASLLPHWPVIGSVALVYGTLLIVGVYSLWRRWSWGIASQCLLGFVVPLAGAALMTSMSNFSFNVRYTIVSFPFFCLLVGAAIVGAGRRQIWLGSVALLALTIISGWSLGNYFDVPKYGRANVRGAVAHWRAAGESVDLLSVSTAGGIRDVIKRYLTPAEQRRHTWLSGGETVQRIQRYFETHEVRHVYVLLARDWRQRREKIVREAFAVQQEHAFTGVKLLKIAQR